MTASSSNPTAADEDDKLTVSCHCGRVRLTLPYLRPRVPINECRCSVCYKYGALWGYFARDSVKVSTLSPTGEHSSDPMMDGYVRATDDSDGGGAAGDLTFQRCANCGVVTHWWAIKGKHDFEGDVVWEDAEGRGGKDVEKMGVNMRLVPEKEVLGMERKVSNGP